MGFHENGELHQTFTMCLDMPMTVLKLISIPILGINTNIHYLIQVMKLLCTITAIFLNDFI